MLTLTTKDRLVISAIFPREADIRTQCLIRELSERISLSSDEIEEIGLTQENGQARWKENTLEPIKIELSLTEQQFLDERIGELNDQKKITQDMLDICLSIQSYRGKSKAENNKPKKRKRNE